MISEELKLKLESNEFDLMWELVADILLKISGKLYLSENFEKNFSPFLLCRFLSMKENLIEYAKYLNIVNSNSNLTKTQFYKLAYSLIPKQKNSFIKYIKKKEKQKKKNNDIIFQKSEIKNSIFDI